MSDMFGANWKYGGRAFGAASVQVKFSGASTGEFAKKALVQNVQLAYQQTVNQIKELGSRDIYYVVGSPSGSGQCNRIVMDAGTIQTISDMGDLKKEISKNKITIESKSPEGAGAANQGPFTLDADGAFVQSVQYSISVQDYMLAEQAAFQFTGLIYGQTGGTGGGGGGPIGD